MGTVNNSLVSSEAAKLVQKSSCRKPCPDCPWSKKIARQLIRKNLCCLENLVALDGDKHDYHLDQNYPAEPVLAAA